MSRQFYFLTILIMNENLTIKSIICKPRSLENYEYIINTNHRHMINKKKLILFICSHINGYYLKISNLIRDNLPFLVLVPENEVHELKFNFDKERKIIKDQQKNSEFILNQVKLEKNKKTNYLDQFIDLSEEIKKHLT